jgi:RimJ/RimL family protein N-acetyltransferase
MAWTTTSDPEAYLAAAGEFLWRAPAANSVELTGAEGLRIRGAPAPPGPGEPLLGWWRAPGAAISGAFLHTPPYPVHVTAMPAAAAAPLAAVFAATERPVSGVTGDAEATDAFAAAWSARTGARTRVHRRMRLHRLGDLADPVPVAEGAPSPATAAHRELLIGWYEAFIAEIDDIAAGVGAVVDDRIAHGGLTLWLRDGEPVSVAGVTRQVAGMARVAPVYTPPEHRGRGYAAAVTAVVSRAALEAGAREVLLFTDLANPTSNRLYARLGYRPVEDRVVLTFSG